MESEKQKRSFYRCLAVLYDTQCHNHATTCVSYINTRTILYARVCVCP